VPKPPTPAQADLVASKPVAAPAEQQEPVRKPDMPAPKPPSPVQADIVASRPVVAPAQQQEPVRRPDTPAPKPPSSAQADIFASKPVAASAGQHEPDATARSFFDLQSALTDQQEPDATTRSFFDLQSALATDASLGFDYDSSSEHLSSGDQEGSPFSVLNVVKNIALQDPKQDTPQFHLNLGIAYMQCCDYEQAVDEFLSALYGIPDKIGCYVRLAECSLKLQRRELACGFLREALDCPEITPEQVRNVRKRLDELSAG
jgi:tetratricopeptide (TPR) repeat protein